MDTKRSLPKYILTVFLVMFIICGFTITPIAAAEVDANNKYMFNVRTNDIAFAGNQVQVSEESFGAPFEAFDSIKDPDLKRNAMINEIKKNISSNNHVSRGEFKISICAADIENYIRQHPEFKGKIGETVYTARDVEKRIQQNPDFVLTADEDVIFTDEDIKNFGHGVLYTALILMGIIFIMGVILAQFSEVAAGILIVYGMTAVFLTFWLIEIAGVFIMGFINLIHEIIDNWDDIWKDIKNDLYEFIRWLGKYITIC